MVTFFFIGGKDNLPILNNRIESELIKLTNKKTPHILFCPYASYESIEKANARFLSLMQGLDCEIKTMGLEDQDRLDELLHWSDIFYIGGGCCNDLVSFFISHHYEDIIRSYLESDKFFGGISAGAMLFTKIAMGDKNVFSDNFHMYNFKMVECLNILNISICPHYQNEDLIIYNDAIKKWHLKSFGIENNTALLMNGNKYKVIKENKANSVYYFDKNDFQMIPLYEGKIYHLA